MAFSHTEFLKQAEELHTRYTQLKRLTDMMLAELATHVGQPQGATNLAHRLHSWREEFREATGEEPELKVKTGGMNNNNNYEDDDEDEDDNDEDDEEDIYCEIRWTSPRASGVYHTFVATDTEEEAERVAQERFNEASLEDLIGAPIHFGEVGMCH